MAYSPFWHADDLSLHWLYLQPGKLKLGAVGAGVAVHVAVFHAGYSFCSVAPHRWYSPSLLQAESPVSPLGLAPKTIGKLETRATFHSVTYTTAS